MFWLLGNTKSGCSSTLELYSYISPWIPKFLYQEKSRFFKQNLEHPIRLVMKPGASLGNMPEFRTLSQPKVPAQQPWPGQRIKEKGRSRESNKNISVLHFLKVYNLFSIPEVPFPQTVQVPREIQEWENSSPSSYSGQGGVHRLPCFSCFFCQYHSVFP